MLTVLQLLHWDAEGRQIVIQDSKAMEVHVLPMVYKQSKFASFSRQLNVGRMSKGWVTFADDTLDLRVYAQVVGPAGRDESGSGCQRVEYVP